MLEEGMRAGAIGLVLFALPLACGKASEATPDAGPTQPTDARTSLCPQDGHESSPRSRGSTARSRCSTRKTGRVHRVGRQPGSSLVATSLARRSARATISRSANGPRTYAFSTNAVAAGFSSQAAVFFALHSAVVSRARGHRRPAHRKRVTAAPERGNQLADKTLIVQPTSSRLSSQPGRSRIDRRPWCARCRPMRASQVRGSGSSRSVPLARSHGIP